MITRFYPYTLTLKAPLLLTSLEGDPNSVCSLGFIPGSALRGAVASRLQPDTDLQTFRQYILSGQICYLNAYPTIDSQRTLPAPASFRQEKYGDTVHDLAFYPSQSEDDKAWPDEQLTSVEASFLSVGRANLKPALATVDSRVHQQRDRSAGRAYTYTDPEKPDVEERRGTIFTYEALEAGQEFQGLFAISGAEEKETDILWQTLKDVLGERVSVGRSRSSRYGGAADITYGDSSREHEVEGSDEIVREALPQGALFRVLLTADYIGRCVATGQNDPTAFRTDLQKRLGENRVDVLETRWAFRLVGGFNRKWGLPLPQTLALRAGSLLVLEAQVDIPYADLLALEQAGLGERRTEGFGRVIFLKAPRKTEFIGKISEPPALEAPQKEVPVPQLINVMQKRILTDALEHRITDAAAKLARDTALKQIPSPSLLGRLRVPLRKGTADGLETLNVWLNNEEDGQCLRRPAMNQLDECRIDRNTNPLSRWLRDVLNPSDSGFNLAETLSFTKIQKNYIESRAAAGHILTEDADLLLSTRLRLIDEVLALLARRKRSESRGEEHAND